MSNRADIIRAAANAYNPHVFHLAGLADCATPDEPEHSPGAAFLQRCAMAAIDCAYNAADELAEQDEPTGDGWAEVLDYDGTLHEAADGVPSVYTHELWSAFADLAAYNEDVSEYGPVDDMTTAAGVALYLIAERCIRGALGEIADTASDAYELADA